ncbi:MAG: hypothetical protein PUK70_01710 [Bacteroidales bacterium]|nr:hypothetical protein [Bacteroidales bacterium]MDY6002649.1 hypothetical protein [Candidatus Cryptobacteroides sp.]
MNANQQQEDKCSHELYDKVSTLVAIGWPDEDIARFLGISMEEYNRRTSDDQDWLHKAVGQGGMEKKAETEIALAKAASAGDISAMKEYSSLKRDKSFSISKLDLFGGTEKEGSFEKIRDYIASGSKGTLSGKEQLYINLLNLVYSLDGQYGKRRTIKFLTSPPMKMTFEHASTIYSEATELFYCNRNVSKEAMRNKIADQFDSLYVAARNAAETSKDYEIAASILAEKAKVLRLDKEDPEKLPPEVYLRSYRVLSLTPKAIGLPEANRSELAKQIDSFIAPEAIKERLRMDAGVKDMDVVKLLDNAEQEEG